MYKVFADKLLDFAERHAEEIARQWCKSIRTSPRTPSYHSIPEEECFPQAALFYRNLRRLYFTEEPYQEASDYFTQYAEARNAEGIPLHEAIYALIMMRRHIWVFAEFQALFISAADLYQAVESINRVVLIFDYAVYIVSRKYQELTR